jgi:hypothetical protein
MGKPERCHYGCGMFATMTEPGKPWKAHKVCAEGDAGGEPLGAWDGEEHKVVSDGPIGCGGDDSPQVRGMQCAGAGSVLACVLCPQSPNYWRRAPISPPDA